MTTVIIKKFNNSIVQVECSGHTENEIVCAALSSITQTAVRGVLKITNNKAEFKRNDDGYLKITLPKEMDEKQRHDCDVILETMLLGIKDLQEGFSKLIKLEER